MPVWLAAIVSIIPFGLGSLLMAIAFWLYYQMRKVSSRWWSYSALICFWLGYEYLHQTWPLAFPWMNLGNGFAWAHYLVQWYEFTGVYGGTFWVLMSNILIFETYLAFKTNNLNNADTDKLRRNRIQLLVRSIAHIIIPVIVSLFMYYSYQEKLSPANVIIVQPNIDPYAKFGMMPAAKQVETLIRLSDSLGQDNTEYFIWPETAIAKDTDEDKIRTESNYLSVRKFLNKYKNGNVITGIESYALYKTAKTETARLDPSGKYFDVFNAAIQIENSPKVQFYHKSKLVPGVEQIPFSSSLSFIKPLFQAFGGSAGSYGKQDQASVFYSQSGIGAAPVICYESIWGEYVADYVQQGAQFIAIITNDAWWGNTSGKDQHLQYAKLRAIETRRWVARSANTGISAFINQRGDIVQQSGWWQTAVLKADINLNDEQTFYAKHQDYIALTGCFGSGIFILMLAFKRFFKPTKNQLHTKENPGI